MLRPRLPVHCARQVAVTAARPAPAAPAPGPAPGAAPAAEDECLAAPRQQPLSAAWRDWIRQPGWSACEDSEPRFDALVVGSGYGGSVAALRLAQKGYRVLVLERGSEYLPGEFPNDFSGLPKYFRINHPLQGQPLGRASGLVELHLGQGMVAVTGNGLGGGSLVNAGVLMQPDPDVFAQPQWPAAIRSAPAASLQPHFRQARRGLQARRWEQGLAAGAGPLRKTSALQRLGADLRAPVRRPALTVDPDRCLRCGDCASGCNVPGGKQTLGATYLAEALATGRVQIVTQAEAYRLEPWEQAAGGGGAPVFRGWRLQVFATDAQQEFLATRELFAQDPASGTARWLRAPLLFLCAGALGSTQLMQRSQARAPGQLAFSPALGTRLSGNGDSLSWVANERSLVNAVGRGKEGSDAWLQGLRDGLPDADRIVGPTITAAIDLRRRPPAGSGSPRPAPLPLAQRLVVQDGAAPRALAPLVRELLATMAAIRALDGWWTPAARYPGPPEDPLAASEAAARHAQLLLVMGHDGSPGRMVWQQASDRSAPVLADPQSLATYQAQQALFDRIGRRHVHNPLWKPLPEVAQRLMSGARPAATVTTVHPLGGCPMGDGPDTGVVNHLGQVWVHDAGRFHGHGALQLPGEERPQAHAAEPRLYRGLFVLDGAIVPTALGCNPLWTITALAERALAAMPCLGRPGAVAAQRDPPRRPCPLPSEDVPVDARLHETLRAAALRTGGALAGVLGPQAGARLEVCFRSPDIAATLRTPRHAMTLEACLWLGPHGGDAAAKAVYRTPSAGAAATAPVFEALPAGRTSSGPWLLLAAITQLAFLLVLPIAGGLLAGWPGALAAALPALVAAPLLPFPRTVLTWWWLRGRRDVAESLRSGSAASLVRKVPPWLWALARQMVHASEKRVMSYCIPLELQAEGDPDPALPREVTLRARKTVMYRASLREMLAWLRGQGPLRPTVWEQIMDAEVRLYGAHPGGRRTTLLRGRMHMGFDSLTASGLSSGRRQARGAMELDGRGDTTSGTLALAGYPLLFLRHALKTRLLDFRLPSYSGLPVADNAPREETRLRIGRGEVLAEAVTLQVARGTSNSDRGDEPTAPVPLTLWRYRRRSEGRPVPPAVRTGTWLGVPVRRARSVLLLHAFGQSGLSYTLKTVRRNLAESFYKRGYEVWVLESRISTRSGLADQPCSIDQVGLHDVPEAVAEILRTLEHELGAGDPLQVSAFGQCMGAAALWMALLSGRLSHGLPGQPANGGDAPLLSKLSHMMSSQVHPLLVGGRVAQSKTWMPALLQAVWRRGAIPFAVRGPQEGLLMPLLDRVFGSMPAPAEEGQPWQGSDDAAATCRRIRYIEAPLFRHANLNAQTRGAMNRLFGDANLRSFAQARRFLERERLVNEDGGDRYVNDQALRRHAALPIQLLHGEANELFDAASARQSFELLGSLHGGWQAQFCVQRGAAAPQPLLVPGYGHLDVLIGQSAACEVFPGVLRFFDGVLARPDHVAQQQPARGWVARTPRIGPFVGWLREASQQRRLRISLVLDARGSLGPGEVPPVVLRFRPAQGGPYRNYPGRVDWRRWRPGRALSLTQQEPQSHEALWADIALDGAAAGATQWQVFSLHRSWHPHPEPLPSPDPDDEAFDAWLARACGSSTARVTPALSDADDPFDPGPAQFRLPPAALQSLPAGAPVRFGLASCRHPGLGVDLPRVDRTVDDFLLRQHVRPSAFALLLGDQIYADATAGLLDPSSPLERYAERHEVAFGRQGLGRLLAQLPVYMTPDDHEYTDSFPLGGPLVRSPWPDPRPGSDFGRRQRLALRVARRAITVFQRLQSPLGAGVQSWYSFDHGCVRVFVFDTRFARKRDAPVVVRPASLDALRAWLDVPEAAHALNVVASGSVLLPGLRPGADPANPGPLDTWQHAPAQRQAVLQLLAGRPDRRFLLLSGDYHLSGAALVQVAGEVRGAAVVAPPLYAPLPYANAAPDAVWADEPIVLAQGPLRLLPVPQGAFARGSALGELDVQPLQGGGFEISYRRELQVWESGRSRSLCARLRL